MALENVTHPKKQRKARTRKKVETDASPKRGSGRRSNSGAGEERGEDKVTQVVALGHE